MNSKKIFEESLKYMPGGVNSPVRAFNEMGIDPIVVKEGNGVILTDEDGKEYIDFLYAWGPLLLGHKDEDIMKAVYEALKKGISFGTATEYELILAKHICNTLPQVDMLRMVNSGTEATMSAVKLARGYTKREKIVKFNGCYHGHYDGFLIKAGSGIMTENIPGSLGVTKGAIENTLTCDYNSIEGIRELFKTQGEEIAAVIVEAVAGNMGVIKADKEFLLELRRLCDEYGAVLIFDEVMTGFRVSYEGAGGLYGIKSDLSTYAKIMGGGFPCGAYGGKKEIMECLSPLGGVYQAGTMSGNPVVMAAGYAALKKLYENKENYYEHLENLGAKLEKGIKDIAKEKGIPVLVSRCGSMLTPFFTEKQEVKNYEDALTCNREMYKKFFKHLYKNGIYVPQSQFESSFISVKHKDEHIEKYLEAFKTL